MQNKLATPEDYMRYELTQAKQTIEQLRANAKSHKKTVDKMSAKVSQLTQQRYDAATQLSLKEQEAAFYKTELEMRGYKTFNVGGHAAMSMPADSGKRSDTALAFIFAAKMLSTGFFLAMGAALALFSIGVIGK